MMRALAAVLGFSILLWDLGFSEAGTISKSARSREAVKRTRSRTESQLNRRGWQWGNAVFIRVFKDESVLELWIKTKTDQYELYKTFPICQFSGGLGPKMKTGDRKAPEGFYSLGTRSFNPYSSYHLSLNIGYPNKYDLHHRRTGNYLMIHGDCVSIGCLAMTDSGIEEIYALVEAAVEAGQSEVPLHIFPFRLEHVTLYRHLRFAAFDFWRELRDGYKFFERHRRPPRMAVIDGRYVIMN